MITRLLAWFLAALALLAAALAVNTWRQTAIKKAVRQTFAGTIVSPGLFTARADAGYFDGLADNVYLFSPVRVRQADTARFHGVDERIAIANYAEMVRFYHLFIQEAAR